MRSYMVYESMEAVIFTGIQATGKSTFFKEKFFNSHIHVSLDILNTRNNEQAFLEVCFATQKSFVVDNTNPTIKERSRYIQEAKHHQYRVVGYYFTSPVKEAVKRNEGRTDKNEIPPVAIKATAKKLEVPSYNEGFDLLYAVEIKNNKFIVKAWNQA